MTKRSIFSRVILVLMALGVLVLAYWFINTSLTPVVVPQQLILRSVVRFDPKLDISSNEKFLVLRPLGEFELSLPKLGRDNPFVPPVVTDQMATSTATSTEAMQVATSTVATTTQPAPPVMPPEAQATETVTTTEP